MWDTGWLSRKLHGDGEGGDDEMGDGEGVWNVGRGKEDAEIRIIL